jgi:hypothetical protein
VLVFNHLDLRVTVHLQTVSKKQPHVSARFEPARLEIYASLTDWFQQRTRMSARVFNLLDLQVMHHLRAVPQTHPHVSANIQVVRGMRYALLTS